MQKKQNHLASESAVDSIMMTQLDPIISSLLKGFRTPRGERKPKASLACCGIFLFVGLLVTFAGCRSLVVSAPPDKRSEYKTMDAEAGVSMVLRRDGDSVLGQGTIGGKEFVLTAVQEWRAIGMAVFPDGKARPITIQQSADGSQIVVHGLGSLINLSVSTEASLKSIGPFEGKFVGGKAMPIQLSLFQSGNLLSGIGRYGERPVSVIGNITGADNALGYLVFADESRIPVTAELDGDVLKVGGLGEPVKLRRVH